MDTVRLGIIGCGSIASKVHMPYMKDVEGLEFVAVADQVEANRTRAVETYGVEGFDDGIALMESRKIDAVLITTPHYSHPELSMAAMQRGLHVLTEKPVAVTAQAAQQVNDFHAKHPDRVYAAMFQQRTRPAHKYIKQLIESGQLGDVMRVNWIITDWFRPNYYFATGSWRATWKGEGGGALINQCPHNIDLMIWWAGMPQSVIADTHLGRHHDIEVEDEVTAIFRYPNGASGVFITSTGEAPGTNRLEITGSRGKVVYESNSETGEIYKLQFTQTAVAVPEFSASVQEMFPVIDCRVDDVTPPDYPPPHHKTITQNFADAILGKAELVAPGEEGIHSIELANAMLMAGVTRQRIELPMDRSAFDAFLKDLIAKSDR